MDDDFIKALGYLSLIPLVLAYAALVYMLQGWVLLKLWAWFVVPYFGIRPLRLVEALGLAMVVTFLTWRSDLPTKKRNGWAEQATGFLDPVLHAFICLGIGWIIHRFY